MNLAHSWKAKWLVPCVHLGADYVVDTNFGADLTVMEEASELVERLKTATKFLSLQAAA